MTDEACRALSHTVFGTALEVCREIRGRLPDMDTDQLLESYKVLSVGAVKGSAGDQPSSVATAQAVLQIKIGDELIEVPRPQPSAVTNHVTQPQQL